MKTGLFDVVTDNLVKNTLCLELGKTNKGSHHYYSLGKSGGVSFFMYFPTTPSFMAFCPLRDIIFLG